MVLLRKKIRKFLCIFVISSIFFTATTVAETLEERLHSRAEENIDDEKPLLAIRQLGTISPDLRTNHTLALTEIALLQLEQKLRGNILLLSENSSLDHPNILSLLNAVQNRNPEVKRILTSIYKSRIFGIVAEGNSIGAERYFQVLAKELPEEELDKLALNLALHASGEARSNFGKARIAELEVKGKLGFSDKLRLLFRGYYIGTLGKNIVATIVLAFLLFVAFIGLNYIWMSRKRSTGKWTPKSKRGYHQPVDEDDEYSRLLKVLGLDDSATEEDIKTVYRRLVRENHPDKKGTVATDEEVQRFREIQAAYKRLQEMNTGRFG